MIKNFLFDLDGTLLPMDMEYFTKLYFSSLCRRFVPILKVEPESLINAVMSGVAAMVKNDNSQRNSSAFWKAASSSLGMDLANYSENFDDYYLSEFIETKKATSVNPCAAKCVEFIKRNGGRLVVATNPIFPETATLRRLNWAGVSPDDFEYISVYENSGFCKPNLNYYGEICRCLGLAPEESVMIGNDVDEDMCSAEMGFDTYLITDCLINRHGKDYSKYKNGSFEDFYDYLIRTFTD